MRLAGLRLHVEERGATAVLVAASLFMLMGFAALVVDIGAGMNERRQDQSAADVAALAGAVEAKLLGAPSDVVVEALEYVRNNLDTTYSDPEWEALWLGCSDPEKDQAPLDIYHFQPQPTPSTWTAAGTLDCISVSGLGYFRVMIPEQIVPTTFGRVLGVSAINVDASAIARLAQAGVGGILPFGLASDVNDGEHTCLSSGPTGLADDPCVGSDSGNFGTLKGRMFGTPDPDNAGSYLIPPNCNSSPLSDVLAVNIAAGMDHWVTLAADANPANETRDQCFNAGVDTLNTDVGFPNNGAEEGLATGPVSFSLQPRLQQGPSGDRSTRFGFQLNDIPIWEYLVDQLRDDDPSNDPAVPDSCGGFTNLAADVYDWDKDGSTTDAVEVDWDGDGSNDAPESWEHLAACFEDYVSDSSTAVIFCRSDAVPTATGCSAGLGIDVSPRFAYVPQFFEDDLGSGSSWLHIQRFRAIFLQGTWWKQGNQWKVFHPGEDCPGCGGATSYSMTQLSSFVIPDDALPEGLKGDPPPGEIGGPYQGVELWK